MIKRKLLSPHTLGVKKSDFNSKYSRFKHKMLEKVLGVEELNVICEDILDGRGGKFAADLLEKLEIKLVENGNNFAEVCKNKEKGTIFISNMPQGLLDVLILMKISESVENCKILVDNPFTQLVQFKKCFLPSQNANQSNIGKVKEIVKHLDNGYPLIIFPTTSPLDHYKTREKEIDLKWDDFYLRLARSRGSNIVPIEIIGSNSGIFKALNKIDKKLSYSRLIKELLNKKGHTVDIIVGRELMENGINISDESYQKVIKSCLYKLENNIYHSENDTVTHPNAITIKLTEGVTRQIRNNTHETSNSKEKNRKKAEHSHKIDHSVTLKNLENNADAAIIYQNLIYKIIAVPEGYNKIESNSQMVYVFENDRLIVCARSTKISKEKKYIGLSKMKINHHFDSSQKSQIALADSAVELSSLEFENLEDTLEDMEYYLKLLFRVLARNFNSRYIIFYTNLQFSETDSIVYQIVKLLESNKLGFEIKQFVGKFNPRGYKLRFERGQTKNLLDLNEIEQIKWLSSQYDRALYCRKEYESQVIFDDICELLYLKLHSVALAINGEIDKDSEGKTNNYTLANIYDMEQMP